MIKFQKQTGLSDKHSSWINTENFGRALKLAEISVVLRIECIHDLCCAKIANGLR